MKTKKSVLFSLVVIAGFYGCLPETIVKQAVPKPIKYTVLEKSAVFNRKNIAFSMDSLNNKLFIRLTLNGLPKNFPFPVNTKFHDTLTSTAFNFDFYSNGKRVLSDYKFLQATLQWKQAHRMDELGFSSDTIDLLRGNDISIEIPYYAFHSLRKGKQSLELRMWQDTFTDKGDVPNKAGSYTSFCVQAKKALFNARVKFEISVPSVYKTAIYGQGLVLKNDSTFSPSGMDNTIWKSSYPDIYWALVYPKQTLYSQTPYQVSTDKYTGLDTFLLYHYYENDSIGFHVYDHDNLSRDDFMGSWWGAMKDKDTLSKYISFDNIKYFKFKLKKQGLVN